MANFCTLITIIERKTKKAFFTWPIDAALAKIWIAKLNREKDNLSKNVWICSEHFEDVVLTHLGFYNIH